MTGLANFVNIIKISELQIPLTCIIREGTAEGVLGDMRSPKALLAA